jgi:hypothetical protein
MLARRSVPIVWRATFTIVTSNWTTTNPKLVAAMIQEIVEFVEIVFLSWIVCECMVLISNSWADMGAILLRSIFALGSQVWPISDVKCRNA